MNVHTEDTIFLVFGPRSAGRAYAKSPLLSKIMSISDCYFAQTDIFQLHMSRCVAM